MKFKNYTIFDVAFFSIRVFGLNWAEPKYYRWLYILYSILLLSMFNFCFTISMLIDALTTTKHVNLVGNLLIIIGAISSTLKSLNTIREGENIEKLKVLKKHLDSNVKTKVERKQLKDSLILVKRVLILYIVGLVVVVISSLFAAVWAKNRRLIHSAWFPFDWQHFESTYFFILGYQAIAFTTLIFAVCVSDTYTALLSFLLMGHIDILGMRISNIGYSDEKNSHEDLIDCVQYYQLIVKFHKILHRTISPVFLIQLLVTELSVCMSVFALFLVEGSDFEKMYFTMCTSTLLFEILWACSYSTTLMDKSSRLTTQFYSCNWITQDPKFKKDLIILMLRSQRKLEMSAGGIMPMSLQTFLSVMKSAYSLFTLLNQFSQ